MKIADMFEQTSQIPFFKRYIQLDLVFFTSI